MTDSKSITYDDILTHIGGLGLYQKRVLFLATVACSTQSLHLLITIFTMGAQDYRCAIPELPNDTYHVQNEAHQLLLNKSIPFDDKKGSYSQCYRFKVNHSDPEADYARILNTTSSSLEKCSNWVYSTDVFATSIISKNNQVAPNKQSFRLERLQFVNEAIFRAKSCHFPPCSYLSLRRMMCYSLRQGPFCEETSINELTLTTLRIRLQHRDILERGVQEEVSFIKNGTLKIGRAKPYRSMPDKDKLVVLRVYTKKKQLLWLAMRCAGIEKHSIR
ncbi:hypothetical protein RRG08_039065 [Elysia crispata]|uniref:Uncharacterized protein n=1 Tax=Elysia crispata TaxID=231223 RepID=A0AAE1CZU6_9GAST|nr:hypothetical protein RRG08_039065 [Elysia crispata]